MHFLDLPILAREPSYDELRAALVSLEAPDVSDFDTPEPLDKGLVQWLTRLATSDLAWLPDEDEAERLRSLASQRVAAECGATAGSARVRNLHVGPHTIKLFEPGMTEDNLGRLTWGSSLVLSRRFVREPHLVADRTLIELGAGSGLCGITAGLVGATHVDVTDLPEIVPNLAGNVKRNGVEGKTSTYVLDWVHPQAPATAFDAAIVSDPVYSRDHPPLLLNAIRTVAAPEVLLQLPLRAGFEPEREQIYTGLAAAGYERREYEEEAGRDLFGEQTFAYSRWIRPTSST